MIRKSSLLFAIIFALAASGMLSAQNSDKNVNPAVMQAVDAAFPKELTYSSVPSGQGAPVSPYHSCAVIFSRNADGAPNLIAAAFSGNGASIAMLAYNSGEAKILNSVSDHQFWFAGGPCDASIVNLADPAQPQSPLANTVKISFGGADWFFLWDGKKLINITAPYPEFGPNRPPNTDMYSTSIVDMDHSGAMQVVGTNGDSNDFPRDDGIAATGTWTLFRYNGKAYVPASTLRYFYEYSGKYQQPWRQQINLHQTPAESYQLRVINGERDGADRVASATIDVNGVTIFSPSDLNQGVATLSQSIQLKKENVITVTVHGPPNSRLYVTVR